MYTYITNYRKDSLMSNVQEKHPEGGQMTRNQIQYWELQENKQHNRETERQGRDIIHETGRHNRATENIDLSRLDEAHRHNLATEGIESGKLNLSQQNLAELIRSNLERERQNLINLNIASATQQETGRHNVATESLTQMRYQAQNELDAARTKFQDIQNTWEGLQKSQHVTLTDKNIQAVNKQMEQVDAAIKELEARTKKVSSEATATQLENVLREYQAQWAELLTLGEMVDRFIPG